MFKKIAFMWNIIFYNNVKVFVTSDQFNAFLLNRSIVFLNPTQTFEYIWLLNHFVFFFNIIWAHSQSVLKGLLLLL